MQVPQQLFSNQQWSQLNDLIVGLDDQQTLWLSGYLAASVRQPSPAANTPADTAGHILIAFGTETNNCRRLAGQLAERCRAAGIAADTADLASLRLRRLGKLSSLVIITATHGDGDPPEPIADFYDGLMADDAPRLDNLKFAVLALGDSSYEHFCVTGIRIDQRLEALGGQRLIARRDCDVDFEQPAAEWMQGLLDTLPKSDTRDTHAPVAVTTTARSEYNRENPLTVEVISNQNLSHPSRSAPVHHLELELDATDFNVEPGDAVGILADNPPKLVAMVLDACELSGEQPVTLGEQALTLVEVLRHHRDLTIPGKNFLEYWAGLSGDARLTALVEGDSKTQRGFLRETQIRDLLLNYPARPQPQALVDALRPLQPRLYDVANSLAAIDDELHLTVKAYHYAFGDRRESGIASRYLLDLQAGDSVQLYPHRNSRFRLPENAQAPLILVAEGTGIAPYRAFLQALSLTEPTRPCWLVFAEKNFEEDFLYQLDLQKAHADGLLTHVDSLFYEDSPSASLADPLLANRERLSAWLAEGAHIYLCGDKTSLQGCESMLQSDVDQHQGEGQWKQLVKDKRIHRNLY